MRITFTNPVIVGDLGNQKSVASLDLLTIAFNLRTSSGTAGHANVSITLRDPLTGYQAHWVYEDAQALEYWSQVSELKLADRDWPALLIARLMTDKKLPEGVISSERETAADGSDA